MKNNQFPQPICEQIWNGKYRLITPNEDIQDDMSLQDTWVRIAKACAHAPIELNPGATTAVSLDSQLTREEEFYRALDGFGFLPAGRITAGAGSGRSVTLFNCYVMGTVPDSISGIFDMLKEAALTMQQGGGIGYDFSTIRPKNAPVKGVDADASGPLTFMDVWDAMCRTIMSAGSRRGAMMATMRCDHPDIMDFISAKRDAARLRMFNVSVLCTDDFMEAVEDDQMWQLVFDNVIYEEVRARDIWEAIMENTYNYAEPGVLFIDSINNMNNLRYMETIAATNPCGEQPLPPYGACLLGSINLTQIVRDPFEQYANINYEKLENLVRQAVRMLDSVIDISNFPLPEQLAEAKEKRRMGLGITGLADMLFMLNVTYGTQRAADIAEEVMRKITLTAYRESIEMAKQFGPCPATATLEQREQFIRSGFMVDMPIEMRQDILSYGIRNALLTSIAPTGTISLYAGNISSGIEPVFAKSYERKVLENDGSKRVELVEDYAVKLHREWCENTGRDVDPDPEHLVTAQTLTPTDHLIMQEAVQKWVDSSISKTINCPEDISFEDFKSIYINAYHMGLKGCTTYRPNDVTGSVLSIVEEKKDEPVEQEAPVPVESTGAVVLPREKSMYGQTYKLKWDGSNFYVTINNYYDGMQLIPFEIFINTQDMSHFQWTTALTRMMSSVFRRGGDISFVIEDLKSIMDPNGGAWVDGKYLPSFIALLGATLEQHLQSLDAQMTGPNTVSIEEEPNFDPQPTVGKPMQCSSCKGFNVHLSGGCPVCADCGHSKCG